MTTVWMSDFLVKEEFGQEHSMLDLILLHLLVYLLVLLYLFVEQNCDFVQIVLERIVLLVKAFDLLVNFEMLLLLFDTAFLG
jgi:hypothetical protein